MPPGRRARSKSRRRSGATYSNVEHDGLGERDGTASQGDSHNLEAVAKPVVVQDERTGAGQLLVGGACHGRDAERGGDRRDRVHDRAGDFGAVEPHLQHFDRRLDVQPRLRVGFECGFAAATAAAACAAVYGTAARRSSSRSSRAAMAPMRASAVSPLRSKPSAAMWRSSWSSAASEGAATFDSCECSSKCRVVLGGLGLAFEELGEDGERMKRAREAPDESTRAFRCVAPREASVDSRSMAGSAMMVANTSSGSRRCADAKPESEPVVDHEASVPATSIGRSPGSVRTSSRSIGPRRRTTSTYGPSMLCCVSEATVIRDCHESV